MKYYTIGLQAFIVLVAVVVLANTSILHYKDNDQRLLGAKQCTWGPTYWCHNITNAKGCNAVPHCIQTAWLNREVPTDNDSVCQICKDMVTQARDQLRSNETMDELKQVFEGSCNLIPLTVVKKECCKLADDFVPELVETLSSEMNPDQVCTVAGLCNNEEIDKLLLKYYSGALEDTLKEDDKGVVPVTTETATKTETHDVEKPSQKPLLSCSNCFSLSNLMIQKFHASNRDDILEDMLYMCGELSTFTDACANIVLTYFNDIYEHVDAILTQGGMCHMSGVCAHKYHQHPDDPKEEEHSIDLLANSNDDVPCELCQQLVQHLRDLLVANTTEDEFKQVLQGLCNQTKSFRQECLGLVDQYYNVIYNTLVNGLNAQGACLMIGICPRPSQDKQNRDVMFLLPALAPAEIKVSIMPKQRQMLGAHEPKFTQEELKAMTLPIDKLMGASNPGLLVENGEMCTLCEYILHFIQQTLATPAEAEQIKQTVTTVCHKLPQSVAAQCDDFVDEYGDAVIALLIQGLDPRQVCPKLQMCPYKQKHNNDVEVFAPHEIDSDDETDETDKPTCPLCLFAVEQAQVKIKDNKSKLNIEKVLQELCGHLPEQLKDECNDFIQTYSSELIDKLISDFKPQDICVDLKLCPKNPKNYFNEIGWDSDEDSDDDIDSNKVIEDIGHSAVDLAFHLNNEGFGPNCILCEEMIKIAEKRINKRTSKEDIKKALERGCEKLRQNLRPKCHNYVDKYGDKIASLLQREMEPKVICVELGLCLFSEQEDLDIDEALKYDVIAMPSNDRLTGKDDEFFHTVEEASSDNVQDPPSCVLCEFIMTKLEMELKNKTEQDDIRNAIENICRHLPKTVSKSCTKFIDQYAETILNLVTNMSPSEVCKAMKLCMDGIKFDETFITNEIIECGVCHGATMVLLPFIKERRNHEEISVVDMLDVACENLPAKYHEMCSDLIRIYGKSIINLSDHDDTNVCAEIGKCFHNERSSLAFARITA